MEERRRGAEDIGGKAECLDRGCALDGVLLGGLIVGHDEVSAVGVDPVSNLSPVTLANHRRNDRCIEAPGTEILTAEYAALLR
jgi:hypothetical protein